MYKQICKIYNDNYIELYSYSPPSSHDKFPHFWDEFRTPKEEHEIERISLSRTRRTIREYALCNDFQFFSTITVNSVNADRFSLSACQDLLRQKLKKIKRNNKKFAYLYITEQHKDGAFHFHGLIKDTGSLYVNEYGYLSDAILDEIGFNSNSSIKHYNKCCNYIMKYITKKCVRNENNQIYICSRGLKKADRFPLKNNIDFSEFPHLYENDYIAKTSFELDELTLEQKLKIMEEMY